MEYSKKDVIVGEQWLILSKIGEGSFGEVFKAQDINSKRAYAVKRESLDLDHPQLHHESVIYDILAGGPCIPKCHWYGQHDGFDCIVIDLLGSSLKQLQETVRDIPLDIIIDLGCQLISCLEHVHDKGLVYRDIKPENFLFSVSCVLQEEHNNEWTYNNNNDNNSIRVPIHHTSNDYHSPPPSPPCRKILGNTSLYAVDFGLATWWRNPKTKKPYNECKKPIKYKTGTARYASLNVHRGRTHARRDDMESLGYLLLDLLLGGELPWSGVTARTSKAGWDRLKVIKEEILLEDMCLGLPHGIMDYIDYTRRLRFGDRPDYDYLRRLLRGCNETGPFSKLVTPHPHTRMIPSPPRYYHNQQQHHHYGSNYSSKKENHNLNIKRRNSTATYKVRSNDYQNNYHNQYHYQQQQQQQQHDDVFIMDDLAKELPSLPTTPSPPTVNNNNNNASTKKSSSNSYYYRNHSNNNHYRHHSSSNSSQHRQYHYNKRYHNHQHNHNHRPIGWNTHKNDQWEFYSNNKSATSLSVIP